VDRTGSGFYSLALAVLNFQVRLLLCNIIQFYLQIKIISCPAHSCTCNVIIFNKIWPIITANEHDDKLFIKIAGNTLLKYMKCNKV
jgi:hypothetical protein